MFSSCLALTVAWFSGAAGCGEIGVEPLVAGQFPGFDAQLWLHERGHNVGLQHSAEGPAPDTSFAQTVGMRFMFWQLGIGHLGKTLNECAHFEHGTLRSMNTVNNAPVVGAAAASPSGGSPKAADM